MGIRRGRPLLANPYAQPRRPVIRQPAASFIAEAASHSLLQTDIFSSLTGGNNSIHLRTNRNNAILLLTTQAALAVPHAPLQSIPMAASVAPLPDVADFLDHIERAGAIAVGPFSPATHRPYTPTHVLRAYLTRSRIKKLLKCFHRPDTDWETIRNDYLAVFSTLIVINKGTYITHFVQSPNLTDDDLPFRHQEDWPPDCVEFFEEFHRTQWQFCTERLKRQKLSGGRFRDEIILPIISCVSLRDGVDSCTYKVEVDPGYNLLAEKVSAASSTAFLLVIWTSCLTWVISRMNMETL